MRREIISVALALLGSVTVFAPRANAAVSVGVNAVALIGTSGGACLDCILCQLACRPAFVSSSFLFPHSPVSQFPGVGSRLTARDERGTDRTSPVRSHCDNWLQRRPIPMTHEASLHTPDQERRRSSPVHAELHSAAAALSDADLLGRVAILARAEREATVELVAHLAELDARRLSLGQGFASLFSYCTGALGLAEHAAYNRIEVARASREFPALLDLLVDGSLNLATMRLLAPHLRPDNFDGVVGMARGRSKRDVEMLVARLAPPRPTRRPPSHPTGRVPSRPTRRLLFRRTRSRPRHRHGPKRARRRSCRGHSLRVPRGFELRRPRQSELWRLPTLLLPLLRCARRSSAGPPTGP